MVIRRTAEIGEDLSDVKRELSDVRSDVANVSKVAHDNQHLVRTPYVIPMLSCRLVGHFLSD